jgi:hypothetical protein
LLEVAQQERMDFRAQRGRCLKGGSDRLAAANRVPRMIRAADAAKGARHRNI